MKGSNLPIWTPPNLETYFAKIFAGNPLQWNNAIFPKPQLHLLFGQRGSAMEEAVEQLVCRHKLSTREVRCTPFIDETKSEFEREITNPGPGVDLLVICNGHLLPQMNHLAYLTLDLQQKLSNLARFILVISEEAPPMQRHLFWDQFDGPNRVLMSTPNFDTLLQMHKFYFEGWKTHWLHGKVELDDEAYENLVDASGFCTIKDVHDFCQRVFRYCVEHFPEEQVTITWDWLEKHHIHSEPGMAGTLCITNRDPQHAQSRLETISGKGTGPATEQRAEERLDNRSKRVRMSGPEPIPDEPVDIGV